MKKSIIRSLAAAFVGISVLSAASAWAKDYAGKFQGADLSAVISHDGDSYTGTIQRGSAAFPLTAKENNDHLEGTFVSGGASFSFIATMDGDQLTLTTDNTPFAMKREPVNPLTDAALAPSSNPLTQGAAPSDNGQTPAPANQNPTGAAAPDGYTVLATTDYGYTMTTEKPAADNAHAALVATFQDLANSFDGHPNIGGAYSDQREPHNGGAAFTAQIHGQNMKGFVACRAGAQGTSVTVLCCRADIPADEMKKLVEPLGQVGGGGGQANLPLNPYEFPDGTGTIGLPEGWQTNASSCNGTVIVTGPANQEIYIGFDVPVYLPDSQAVQMQQQMAAQGMPTQASMLVSPMGSPGQVLTNLMPQISQMSRAQGLATYQVQRIESEKQIQPSMQGAMAAVVVSDLSRTDTNGNTTQLRRLSRIELDPLMQGNFMYASVDLEAPLETFDKDLPVMLEICASLKPNYEVVAGENRQRMDAQNAWFAGEQAAHNTQVSGGEDYIHGQEVDSNIRDRCFADSDEELIFSRTMLDTATGERTSENLGDIDDIVAKLNENDPGRFVEIPLRDELFPAIH